MKNNFVISFGALNNFVLFMLLLSFLFIPTGVADEKRSMTISFSVNAELPSYIKSTMVLFYNDKNQLVEKRCINISESYLLKDIPATAYRVSFSPVISLHERLAPYSSRSFIISDGKKLDVKLDVVLLKKISIRIKLPTSNGFKRVTNVDLFDLSYFIDIKNAELRLNTDNEGLLIFYGVSGHDYKLRTYVSMETKDFYQNSPIYTCSENTQRNTFLWAMTKPKLMRVTFYLDENGKKRLFAELPEVVVNNNYCKPVRGVLELDMQAFPVEEKKIKFSVDWFPSHGYEIISGDETSLAPKEHIVVVHRNTPSARIGVKDKKTGEILPSFMIYRSHKEMKNNQAYRYNQFVQTAYGQTTNFHIIPKGKYDILVYSPGYLLKCFPDFQISVDGENRFLVGLDKGRSLDFVIDNYSDFQGVEVALYYPLLMPKDADEIKISPKGEFTLCYDPLYKPFLILATKNREIVNYFPISNLVFNNKEKIHLTLKKGISVYGLLGTDLHRFITENKMEIGLVVNSHPKMICGIFQQDGGKLFADSLMPGEYSLILYKDNKGIARGIALPQTIDVKDGMKEIVLDQLPENIAPRPLPELFFGKDFTPFDIIDKSHNH